MRRAQRRQYHYIYKTTNMLNGKFYIGMHSTDNLNDGYIGSGKRLWYSINKHGKENHVCKILEFLPDRKALAHREAELVNEELLQESLCMNLKIGGEGGGKFYSTDHQLKCSSAGGAAHKSKLNNDSEYRKTFASAKSDLAKEQQKLGTITDVSKHPKSWRSDNRHTEETKKRLSESQQKVNRSGENNPMFGKKFAWVNLDGEVKRISLDLLDQYICDGWSRGNKPK